MIALDTNILVYAHREENEFHHLALERLTTLVASGRPWAVPWPCAHEFVAVTTNPRIYKTPTPLPLALAAVESWMASPTMTLLGESGAHWAAFKQLVLTSKVHGPMIHDARIAALCLQHGVRELWSADRDFQRFAGLQVVNPLLGLPSPPNPG